MSANFGQSLAKFGPRLTACLAELANMASLAKFCPMFTKFGKLGQMCPSWAFRFGQHLARRQPNLAKWSLPRHNPTPMPTSTCMPMPMPIHVRVHGNTHTHAHTHIHTHAREGFHPSLELLVSGVLSGLRMDGCDESLDLQGLLRGPPRFLEEVSSAVLQEVDGACPVNMLVTVSERSVLCPLHWLGDWARTNILKNWWVASGQPPRGPASAFALRPPRSPARYSPSLATSAPAEPASSSRRVALMVFPRQGLWLLPLPSAPLWTVPAPNPFRPGPRIPQGVATPLLPNPSPRVRTASCGPPPPRMVEWCWLMLSRSHAVAAIDTVGGRICIDPVGARFDPRRRSTRTLCFVCICKLRALRRAGHPLGFPAAVRPVLRLAILLALDVPEAALVAESALSALSYRKRNAPGAARRGSDSSPPLACAGMARFSDDPTNSDMLCFVAPPNEAERRLAQVMERLRPRSLRRGVESDDVRRQSGAPRRVSCLGPACSPPPSTGMRRHRKASKSPLYSNLHRAYMSTRMARPRSTRPKAHSRAMLLVDQDLAQQRPASDAGDCGDKGRVEVIPPSLGDLKLLQAFLTRDPPAMRLCDAAIACLQRTPE